MTYDKIFKYGTCKESQYGYRLAQKIRFFCRDGNYAVITVRNLEATSVSLRKGGRSLPATKFRYQTRRLPSRSSSPKISHGRSANTPDQRDKRSAKWSRRPWKSYSTKVGGVAKPRGTERTIELEYSFDRLSSRKIGQAYQLLVPDKNWCTNSERNHVKGEFGGKCEGCSDLCASIIGPTKRGTDYCQPDCSVDRILPPGRLHSSR